MYNKKLEQVIIYINSTILCAVEKLDANKKRFLICLDENDVIVGTLVDGDIRRAIIKKLSIHDTVNKIISKDFLYLEFNSTFDTICDKFKSEKIDFLPILDKKKKLINVITKKQFHILLLENVDIVLNSDFTLYDEYTLEHEIYNRPWGFYKSTILTLHAQSKIITLFPHSELSLQEHKKREEHWIIIKGSGTIILGSSEIDAYPGKYIFIPKGCKHQIINSTDENLVFAEVQLGEYFGEDDIIRYSDKYGRK